MTDLGRVLELVVKFARAPGRVAEIAQTETSSIKAVAGEGVDGLEGRRVPIAGSLAAAAMQSGDAALLEVPADTFAARELGACSAIVTPMLFRNRPIGFLVVLDRIDNARLFG